MVDQGIVMSNVIFWTDMIDKYNGLSFFVPESRIPGINPLATETMLAFFNVVSLKESVTSETTEKKIVLFDEASQSVTGVRESAVRTISDNIVVHPKKYTVTGLIPKGSLDPLITPLQNMVSSMGALASVTANGATNSSSSSTVQAVNLSLETIKKIVRLSFSILSGLFGTESPTMAALQLFQEKRAVLRFKTPFSWKFRYVIINSSTFNAVPETKEFLEATLELQEVNLMAIDPVGSFNSTLFSGSKVTEAIG